MISRIILILSILTLSYCSTAETKESPEESLTENTNSKENASSVRDSENGNEDLAISSKETPGSNESKSASSIRTPIGKTTKLKLDEAINRALENNPNILRKKLDLAKADTDEQKNQGRYAWRAVADASIDQQKLPFNQNNLFSGTKQQTNTYNAGIEKLFSTGTYFKVNVNTKRFDSNAFEDQFRTPAGFGGLGIGPLYTSSINLTIAQDLLKNAFGYKERKTEQILENNTLILKDQLEQELSQLIVESLVDYWDYSVKDNSVETYEQLLENTKNIRNLTIRKRSLGLSEGFEVNQWNALYAQAESQLQKAIVDRDEAQRKLVRTLALDPNTKFNEITPLVDTLPSKVNYDSDLAYAYKHRADFRNMARKKENSELGLKIAKSDALPTLKVSGTLGYQGQNLISTGENFSDKNNGITSQKFPVRQGAVDFSYPLNDKGVEAGIRDAEITKRQALLEESDLVKAVADDVKTRIDLLKSSYKIYENARVTEEESKKYYNGVVRSFQQGRFNAVAVKNALDSLVQDQLSLIRAKVDYNINLHRYYVAKNSLFEEYKIDKEKLVPNNL
ncbi:MAG: TolC family protein [Leptospiraceae bacterium]|nr:TolC family protein [Leptospiraceae bacterium]